MCANRLYCKSLGITAMLLVFSVSMGRASAQTEEQFRGGMQVETESGEVVQFPLTALGVRAHVVGGLSEVTVEQTYENPFDERIEAVYVFPLPEEAAVVEMIMVIGERRIRADLQEREEARRTYQRARDRGQTASLLEQERPNVFTQSVANIQPGHPIVVSIRLVEQLRFEDGFYHFEFPMVVGPRYLPGDSIGHQGTGVLHDTASVPDASRITPPVFPEGVAVGYEVDFHLDLEAGMPLFEIVSPSHDIEVEWHSDRHLDVTLPIDQRQPDRDIVIQYSLAGDDPEVGLLTHHDERGGFFTLMVQPPSQLQPDDVRPKEMVFVIDMSGSMSGHPLDTCKAAMRHALSHMNPYDTFQIIRFSETASPLSPRPLANTPANVEAGLAYVDSLSGMGGTNMLSGIRAALSPVPDPERMRIVLFMTDGYIGNEHQIFALIRELVGESRLFGLGVGSSVNRFLLDQMSEVGRGSVFYVNLGESTQQVVERFYGRIRNPVLTDIEVDWNGLEVTDISPDPILDVFDGTPLTLTGRYRDDERGTVAVRGLQGRTPVELLVDVDFSDRSRRRDAIPFIWARRQVDDLEALVNHHGELYQDPTSGVRRNIRDEIVELALQYDLLTRFTSFVAVEERIAADANDPLHTVAIPVALPAGVSEEHIGLQVTPNYFQPGDPELVVWAPENTAAVTAYFNFGLVQSLAQDPDRGCWTTRFLVPPQVDQGEHLILVAIATDDGQVLYEELPYQVDSTAPSFRVTLLPEEVHRMGDVVTFEVRIEQPPVAPCPTPSGDGTEAEETTVCAQVIPERIKFVRIHLPDGRAVRMIPSSADEDLWEFHFRIRESLGAGRFLVLIEVVDVANNTSFSTVWLEVADDSPVASR